METFEKFVGLYPLLKTLRLELKPIGKTLQFILDKGILEQDKHRADSYILVKKIIDEYHKDFIEAVLADFRLKYDSEGKKDSLVEYAEYHRMKDKAESDRKAFKDIQANLRQQIAKSFVDNEAFKRIDKKELIKEDLIPFVEKKRSGEDEKVLISEFEKFTTYFSGFHENRKNMYSAEEKSTSIAYRLVNDNLPKFVDNMRTFSKVQETEIAGDLLQLYADFESSLNVDSINEMFQLEYFNMVLTQKQIAVYNAVIGGKTLGDGTKIKGLNEYINQYNQQHKDVRLPKLKLLFKQILSDRHAVSWLPEEFGSDKQVLDAIRNCYEELDGNVLGQLRLLLETFDDFSLNNVFIRNDLQLTDVSQKIFGNWRTIQDAIQEKMACNVKQGRKESSEKYQERIAKNFKSSDSFSIGYINECLSVSDKIDGYFSNLGAVDNEYEQKENHFAAIANAYVGVHDLLNNPYPEGKKLSQDEKNVEKIKQLLDAIKALQHFVKPLLGSGNEPDKDEHFYGEFTALWNELDQITPLYNKVRNYVTRKPYSEEKIKLNFENNGALLGGWVDSKTEHSDNGTQYGGYLFRRKNSINEYDYYLGISSDTKLFRNRCSKIENGGNYFERLNYYQLKSQSIYGSSYRGNYSEDKERMISVIDKFIEKSFNGELKRKVKEEQEKRLKKSSRINTPNGYLTFIKEVDSDEYGNLLTNNDFLEENKKLIKTIKETLRFITRVPKAQELSCKEYTLFTEIMNDVETLCKEKIFEYIPINEEELNDAINRTSKTLFMFKISNKDLSYADSFVAGKRESRGVDNLHTMYFKMLMSGSQNVLDIGSGEVFYRAKSKGLKAEPIHYANIPIQNKNEYTQRRKPKSIFAYDLIKDRRYTRDSFLFHLSIVQNYAVPKVNDINPLVNEYLKSAADTHIIGIDRGERHLLYLVVIDQKGNIKKQFSLNEIVNEYQGKTYSTNYHDLLDKREKARLEARKSWQSIENIKELKEGYLSQVIHKIAELMVEYHAIVVLEDLNIGFIRGRQKVEKQVYQKFEKMLIDKLNYLVDKKKNADEPGGVLNAYQLTNKFESFQKLGKQSGFLFYVPAWNTSKIDPQTGFTNLLPVHYENVDKSKAFFCNFNSIRYNAAKDWFEFDLDYDKFGRKVEGTKARWLVCTYGTRIELLRNKNSKWESREVNLTEEFKEHFKKFHIDIRANLKDAISNQTDKAFFERLLHLLKLTLQMRNSIPGTDTDYLISPVSDENGKFYDSRSCGVSLPENADANGAYNIARKGLWVLKQIQKTDGLKGLNLAISNREWLRFAQEKPYLSD